jgi:non-ribosomal peptide synthetase component F
MVPFGATGELYLSGYQTTNGYLNNPQANEKALSANPFDGDVPGYEVMYKTGDLARYLPDGSIGIIGRLRFQKILIHRFGIIFMSMALQVCSKYFQIRYIK